MFSSDMVYIWETYVLDEKDMLVSPLTNLI